jgi:hypothetical protein
MPPRRHAYEWNRATGRYYDRTTGRFVSNADVRRAIDRALDEAAKRAGELTNRLRERAIGPREWARGMRGVIRDVQLYSAASAKGGWAQLTPQDYGRIGARVREQLAFLNRFAAEIKSGKQPMDGRAMARAKLYAQAGRRIHHDIERDEMAARGYRFEENVLAPADHCAGCLAATARGIVPIGTLPAIGTRDCGPNDRCHFRYHRTAAAAA